MERMASAGALELAAGGARRPGFEPALDAGQARACERLEAIHAEAGLAPPTVEELPEELRKRADLPELLRYLEGRGVLRTLTDGLFIDARVLQEVTEAVPQALGGLSGLGPADFREVLPVSRRHLIPLLQYLDGIGVTVRRGGGRDVVSPPGDGSAGS